MNKNVKLYIAQMKFTAIIWISIENSVFEKKKKIFNTKIHD